MKDMAKNLVLESKAYGAALQPEIDGGYNQAYETQLISENVAQLLKDGIYLKHREKDSQVLLEILRNKYLTDFFILGTKRKSGSLCSQATLHSVLL